MKLITRLPVFLLGLGVSVALQAQEVKVNLPSQNAQAAPQPAQPPAPHFTDEQLAETMGWILGKRSGLAELQLTKEETDAFTRGLLEAGAGKEAPYDLQKVGPAMDGFIQKKQQQYIVKAKQQGATDSAAFFAKLKDNKNVVALPDGLYYEIVKPGDGAYPKSTQVVKVNYTGTLLNGTVFDSSVQRGQPAEFQLNQVIPGWSEGIQKINKGGKIRLYIPADLAYGDEPRGPIPPSSTLIFDIELLDIKDAPPPTATPAPAAGSTP